jgi:hypothetical protein
MGYALVLKGACSPDWRGPLHSRILESQAAALEARSPPALAARRNDPPGIPIQKS